METVNNFWWVFVVYLFSAICLMGVFNKAGRTTWKAFVPILNVIVLTDIIRINIISLLLLFIPIIGQIYIIYYWYRLARAFNKGIIMALILTFFTPIGLFILAVGKSYYLYN